MTLPPEIWSLLLGPLGTLVLALVVIVALLKEWVVPKGRLEDKQRQLDHALRLADKAWDTNARITARYATGSDRLAEVASHGLLSEVEQAQTRIRRRPRPSSGSGERRSP